MKKIFFAIIVFVFELQAVSVSAMSSSNYQINADSINSGGNLSSSSNFSSFDSVGESFIGPASSANFAIAEGLSPMVTYSIVLTLDSNVKNLGSISPGTPITANTTALVTTDSWGGYDLYVSENNNLTHSDATATIDSYSCTISAPCLWTGTGFGFTVSSGTSVEAKWGTNPGYNYASFTTSPTIFHTKNGYKSGADSTVVEYKLDVPSTQKSGVYSNTLTYIAIAKL